MSVRFQRILCRHDREMLVRCPTRGGKVVWVEGDGFYQVDWDGYGLCHMGDPRSVVVR